MNTLKLEDSGAVEAYDCCSQHSWERGSHGWCSNNNDEWDFVF